MRFALLLVELFSEQQPAFPFQQQHKLELEEKEKRQIELEHKIKIEQQEVEGKRFLQMLLIELRI